MLRLVVLVSTDASEESTAFIIRVTRIGKLGTTLAVTSNVIPYYIKSWTNSSVFDRQVNFKKVKYSFNLVFRYFANSVPGGSHK
jgi:hypothetical protein